MKQQIEDGDNTSVPDGTSGYLQYAPRSMRIKKTGKLRRGIGFGLIIIAVRSTFGYVPDWTTPELIGQAVGYYLCAALLVGLGLWWSVFKKWPEK